MRQQILGVVLVEETIPDEAARDKAAAIAAAGRAISKAVGAPLVDLKLGPASPPLTADGGALARILELERRVLLICGGLLEGAVTQIALHALTDGFDIFVGADLVWSAEPEREALFLGRISASFGNVLTHRQILRELLAIETNDEKRRDLATLMEAVAG